ACWGLLRWRRKDLPPLTRVVPRRCFKSLCLLLARGKGFFLSLRPFCSGPIGKTIPTHIVKKQKRRTRTWQSKSITTLTATW
ncbi:Transcriptional regulator, partial [Dysosmobacter welbionis]